MFLYSYRLVIEHTALKKVAGDLKEDVKKLTSENRDLKKTIEKYKNTKNTCRTKTTSNNLSMSERNSSTHTYNSGHSDRNACNKCGISAKNSMDSCVCKKSVSLCSSCDNFSSTVGSAKNRIKCDCVANYLAKSTLQSQLIEMKKMLTEKDNAHRLTLNDMERRHCKNEQKFKKDMAELKSKHAQEFELFNDHFKQCDYANLTLEKELNESLKRGTYPIRSIFVEPVIKNCIVYIFLFLFFTAENELRNRIKELRAEISRKDMQIEYEQNNVLNMRERKSNLDCLKKSLEIEKDRNAKADERIKTFV